MKCGLANDVDLLIERQTASWPMLARGLDGLSMCQTRAERVAGRDVLVRHIPHRIVSTTAAVDAASISRRPCFLCPANLPPGEEGIAFDSDFTIYCNPFPILDRHLTIVHAEHRPQGIGDSVGAMWRLAEALPGFFIIYNGAECGASAPDHLHFQACSRAIFPIEEDTRGFLGRFIPNYGRRVFVFRERSALRLEEEIHGLMTILGEVAPRAAEPMVNIAVFHDHAGWTTFVFPRAKHRPRVYETGELTVSPATIDLCGIFVAPVLSDFERIRGVDIESIFEEVTLPEGPFEDALKRLESKFPSLAK
jgi:hypothetical protein